MFRTLLLLLIFLAPSPALAQLGQGGDDPPADAATPQLLPELPDADWQFAFDAPTRGRRAPAHFHVLRDTPGFGNGSALAQGCHEGGVCHGLTHLVLDWYTRILVPIRLQTDLLGETEVEDVLGVPGPVTAANVEAHRLRAWSHVEAQRRTAVRYAIHLQTLQSYLRPALDMGPAGRNAEHLDRLAMADLANVRRGLVPIAIYGPADAAGANAFSHAVLLISAVDGTAVAGNGQREKVTRFRIWDPNMVETAANQALLAARNYLMYFPRAKKLGFPRSYVQFYRDHTRCPPIQTGPFMPDDALAYKNLHQGTAGRTALEGELVYRTPGRIGCQNDQLDWPLEDGGD